MANRTDAFTRANTSAVAGLGTPTDGLSAWVSLVNDWGIYGNTALRWSGAANSVAYLECGSGSGDGTIQAAIVALGQSGLLFRCSDSSNYWYVAVRAAYFALYKVVSGTATLLTTPAGSAAVSDVIQVVLNGASIIVKQNGSTVVNYTDGSGFNATATKHGLFGESAEAASQWDDWSFAGGAPATLTAGNLTLASGDTSGVTVTRGADVGGTTPYTKSLEDCATADGTFAALPSSSGSPYTYTGLGGTTVRWLRAKVVDSAGSPVTAYSHPIPVRLWAAPIKAWIIGNSQSANPDHSGGTNGWPAAFAAAMLRGGVQRQVTVLGNSASSGSRTADWIPGASGTPLETAVAAAVAAGANWILMPDGLMSNDSTQGGNTPTTAAAYGGNVDTINAYVVGQGLKVAWGGGFYYDQDDSGWAVPFGTHAQRQLDYFAQLRSRDNGSTVLFVSDQTFFDIATDLAGLTDGDGLHLSHWSGSAVSPLKGQQISAQNFAAGFACRLAVLAAGATGGGTGVGRGRVVNCGGV